MDFDTVGRMKTTTLASGACLADAQKWVVACGLAPAEFRILLGAVTGMSRAMQIAHPEQVLTDEQCARLQVLVLRRCQGEPIAYLLAEREFYSLSFYVSPAVLIPRPETELLVELALARLPENKLAKVLDMGTGSGIIAVIIAHVRPQASVTAADVSAEALAVARRNGERHGGTLCFVESNWFSALSSGERFDLIVSNPPYIAAGDPHLDDGDLRFEPIIALTDGDDGLLHIRHIVAAAPAHLLPGGSLLFEHGYDQAGACRELLTTAGFSEVQSWRDLAGIERVSGGVFR